VSDTENYIYYTISTGEYHAGGRGGEVIVPDSLTACGQDFGPAICWVNVDPTIDMVQNPSTDKVTTLALVQEQFPDAGPGSYISTGDTTGRAGYNLFYLSTSSRMNSPSGVTTDRIGPGFVQTWLGTVPIVKGVVVAGCFGPMCWAAKAYAVNGSCPACASLTLSANTLSFSAAGGEQSVTVNGGIWNAAVQGGYQYPQIFWACPDSIAGNNGAVVTFTVAANTGVSRTVDVIFKCGAYTQTLTIDQASAGI
jgi:hypothetical protein